MSASPINTVKRYLCVKRLSVNDGFTNKSVKIPRAEGRFFMGELRNRQATPLVLLDEDGNCWELLCTCTGAQYALTRIGAFCEAHGARPGCYFIFYADHEHIVRLAVRQQLPEDVQAAVAAARAAAMAFRCVPQRTAQPEPQPQQPDANMSTSASPAPASQPVVDDPVALDEMPLSIVSGPCSAPAAGVEKVAAVAAASPAVDKVAGPEPAKPMPLQDRSNIPAGVPLTDATGVGAKPKPAGGKSNPAAPGTGGAGAKQTVHAAAADKENDVHALAGSGNVQPTSTPCPVVSTGGLKAPAPAASRNPLQRSPSPRSTTPPPPPQTPPSQQLPRSPPCQPSPSPATRLRLRFEARLRSQAGKLHPLSVRTGPDSPLPSPPVYSGGGSYGAAWPAALPGAYQLPAVAYVSGSLLPPSWGATGGSGNPAVGLRPGCFFSPETHCQPSAPYPSTTATDHQVGGSSCAAGGAAHRQQCATQGVYAAEAATAQQPLQVQQQLCEDWRQQLQCDELLDWDVGRSSAQPAFPRYREQPPSPPQPAGCYPSSGPTATPKLNMGLLRQLLLLQGGPMAQRAFSGPMEACNQTLGQLLGISAARELAARSGTDVLLGQAGEAPQTFEGYPRPSRAPVAQPSDSDGDADTCMDVNGAAPAAMPEQGHEAQQGGGKEGSAMPKSRLSIERDARGLPVDPPHCKRPRAAASRHLMASKSLTAHDLLTDRVELCVTPPASALLTSLLSLRGRQETCGEAAVAGAGERGAPLGERGGDETPQPQAQASSRAAPANQQPSGAADNDCNNSGASASTMTNASQQKQQQSQQQYQQQPVGTRAANVSVDVLVESGARYEGALVLRGASGSTCGGAQGSEWELQGLRPYLIRRQAGLGDVLILGVEETDQRASSCLRLTAQLHQRQIAA
ncbi:hypothetical protein PLESTB_001821300 [Pleodorina starrii]|uniref:Uncharacterized protein n=1 Tax=Pleodorina starrii TaxID=330485 RepID=A0A9W6FAQ7_9CHLO|nr:hypothetical protein PLESTM_000967300 [Pleodorina starrii]GLC61936.1 hypothetical protein PLESTB_001821300 [Pleodorina starrii]